MNPSATDPSPAALLGAVLDALPQAVAVLDAAGQLRYGNLAARTRLAAAGWVNSEVHVRPAAQAERSAWTAALADACSRGRARLLRVGLRGGPAHAALVPLELQGRRLAMLLLDRESLCGVIEMQLFAASVGLTPAESRVLDQLTRGMRPAQIAREHGVSQTTVLTQVASVRAKTGSPSVVSLLQRVAQLPALRARQIA